MWLGALLVSSLGTKLGNGSLRIALGLRHGVPIVVEHKCVCDSKVDVFSTYGGCIPQRAAVNETIHYSVLRNTASICT